MSSSRSLRAVGIGAGYFAPHHYEAWQRIAGVDLTAICDIDPGRARQVADQFGILATYADWRQAIDKEQPDFVDIVTPPETHLEICEFAARRRIHVVCQKPLTPEIASSRLLVDLMSKAKVRFMVHENWRWQPWYRRIRLIAREGTLGQITHIQVLTRLGDGWGPEPYQRQPFFRDYTRLLLHETGVHFIDTFRFLLGEVRSVFASLQRINPAVKGEDAGLLHLEFQNGATAVWDANRVTESDAADPRLTFGEIRVDCTRGHIHVDSAARMFTKKHGEAMAEVPLHFPQGAFGGDCVYALQRHFVDCLVSGNPFESEGSDYLRSIQVVEAAYQSSENRCVVDVAAE